MKHHFRTRTYENREYTFFSTPVVASTGTENCWTPSLRFFCRFSSRRFLRISTMLSSLRRRPSSASTATLYLLRRSSVRALGLSDILQFNVRTASKREKKNRKPKSKMKSKIGDWIFEGRSGEARDLYIQGFRRSGKGGLDQTWAPINDYLRKRPSHFEFEFECIVGIWETRIILIILFRNWAIGPICYWAGPLVEPEFGMYFGKNNFQIMEYFCL